METALKAIAVLLAGGFIGMVLMLVRQCFPGWASDAAIARGAGLALLSICIALPLSLLVTVLAYHGDKPGVVFAAYVTAGLAEESARYVALLLLLRGMVTKDPREFIAGVAAIGIGFGLIENLGYLSSNNGVKFGHVQLGAIRGVVSAPGHLGFAFISAYGLWSVARRGAPFYVAISTYLAAVLLHGTFEVTAMSSPDPSQPNLGGMNPFVFGGLGLAFTLTTVTITIATLHVLGKFLEWASETEGHDQRATAGLVPVWSTLSALLAAAAIGFAAMPLLVAAVASTNTALIYTPVLIGAAGSTALWSMAIGQLSE